MKYFFSLLFLLFIGQMAFAQAIGDFRSQQSGNWNNVATWGRWDGGAYITPAPYTPTSTDGQIIILGGGTVITVTAGPLTVDQVVLQSGGTLTINAGITVTLGPAAGDDINVNAGGILNVNGTIQMVAGLPGGANKLRVDGTVNNNGTFLNSGSGKFIFQSGSNYFHLFDGTAANAIPPAA